MKMLRVCLLAVVALVISASRVRAKRVRNRGSGPQHKNQSEPSLAPEHIGRPDRNETKWVLEELMKAKDLPFHHFLDLSRGMFAKKRNVSLDKDGVVHPVVLVGGLFSSYLVANLSKPSSRHRYCAKTATNVNLWFDAANFLPSKVNCWMENMELAWNAATGQFEDNGVHVETAHWGDVNGFFADMWDIVYAALQPLGYGKRSIRGAQYDWRYGPAEWRSTGHFHKFRELIEMTYAENHGQKVIPISISQGSQFVRNFLVSDVVDAAWKDKYIQSWVSLSGILGGSPESLATIIFPGKGESEDVTLLPWVDKKAFRDMSLAWTGAYAMIPHPSSVGDPTIVTTPARNYTLSQIKEAFVDAGIAPMATSLYDHSGPLVFGDDQLPPPGVDVHCWYGRGSKTISVLHYGKGLSAPPTGFEYADGDGSVVEAGLQPCRQWSARDPSHQVDVQVYPGLQHKDLVIHESPVNNLVKLLASKNAQLVRK